VRRGGPAEVRRAGERGGVHRDVRVLASDAGRRRRRGGHDAVEPVREREDRVRRLQEDLLREALAERRDVRARARRRGLHVAAAQVDPFKSKLRNQFFTLESVFHFRNQILNSETSFSLL
jgi:hypothetical protein